MTRLRITGGWPGQPVPVPPAFVWALERTGSDRFKFRATEGWPPPWESEAELPDEFYLRELFEVDLASDDDLFEFISTWGLLALPSQRRKSLPLEEQREWGMTLRTIVDGCLLIAGGAEIDAGVANQFAWGLNDLFSQTHVRLEVATSKGEVLTPTNPALPLPAAVALQLHNDLVVGAEYRQCAFDGCGRTFSRQRGTAEHGQYRKEGVRYCSRACARAQAARDYRRRQKKERSAR